MMNKSGLEPQGHAVLVLPYEPELTKAKAQSRIVIPDAAEERNTMIETRATVIAVGGECWSAEKGPRAKVGDKILMTKFAGVMVVGPADKVRYRLINDRDIYCKIVKEESDE